MVKIITVYNGKINIEKYNMLIKTSMNSNISL